MEAWWHNGLEEKKEGYSPDPPLLCVAPSRCLGPSWVVVELVKYVEICCYSSLTAAELGPHLLLTRLLTSDGVVQQCACDNTLCTD